MRVPWVAKQKVRDTVPSSTGEKVLIAAQTARVMVMGSATDGREVVQAEEGSSLSYLLLKLLASWLVRSESSLEKWSVVSKIPLNVISRCSA